MNVQRRRAYLEGIAESAESAATRLRALELLDRLDEPERERERMPPAPTSAEIGEALAAELAEDAGRLERVAQLYLESGALQPLIEERARELAEEIVNERAKASVLS